MFYAAAFVSNNLASQYGFLLTGLIKVKEITKIRLITTVIRFFILIVLIWLFDLTGFFMSMFISSMIVLYFFWRETRHLVKTRIKLPNL